MNRYLNFNEIRVLLGGRGRTMVYRDVELGRLPQPIKIGGRLYWREDEVSAILEEMANANQDSNLPPCDVPEAPRPPQQDDHIG